MVVTLSREVVDRYERYSLYNSPYPAHDDGRAIDLYPGDEIAESPVDGEVLDVRTVRCPPKAYADDEDHLILIDRGDDIARILHVKPEVAVGETVAVGEPLGKLVRSGFFARWVDPHVHLEFRDHGRNLERASGSRRLDVDLDIDPIAWDGSGDVIEAGPTHVRLDSPTGSRGEFTALECDEGVPVDGGLPHYAGGGALDASIGTEELSLLGTPIGIAEERDVRWHDVAIFANETRATGLSLFVSRVPFGCKLIFHEGHDFTVGDRIQITIRSTSDPIRLGGG